MMSNKFKYGLLSVLVAFSTALAVLPSFGAVSVVGTANGPSQITRGVAYTPTLPAAITNVATNTAYYWLVDNILHISGQVTFNGAGGPASALTIGLPSGFTIKTAQLPGGTNNGNGTASLIGPMGVFFDAGNGWLFIAPSFDTTTTVKFFINVQTLNMNLFGDVDAINYKIEVPVTNR